MRGLRALWICLMTALISSYSFAAEPRILSAQEHETLKNGGVISQIWRDKSRRDNALEAYAAVDIKASPEQIWQIMTNCAASVEIVKDMTSCRILEAAADGAWDIREQRFDAPFPLGHFKTIFKTQYKPFHRMDIQRRGGDMKIQDAVWTIKPLGSGYSRVTYQARLALKIPVPRFIMRRALRKDTPKLMENLRRASEKTADAPNKSKL